MKSEYRKFLDSKAIVAKQRGIKKIPELAAHLFDFQRHCVEFGLRTGATGCFLDTGLGKTEVQLEWCQKLIEATNKKALIWTPLAVAQQTKKRADRWGYEARVIRDQSEAGPGINICNYDRRERIDPSQFDIVSCDEASILKSFTGKTTRAMIEAFNGTRFKLVATATPAPNDHMELGNYAEFLEIMAANEMLSRFFINDTSTASQEWRLKGHAVTAFYDWLSSWSRMGEKPSDITGNLSDDANFSLPPFNVIRHQARDSNLDIEFAGLFGAVTPSATTIFDIKRQTKDERVRAAVAVIFGDREWSTKQEQTNGGASDTPTIQSIELGADQIITHGSGKNTLQTRSSEKRSWPIQQPDQLGGDENGNSALDTESPQKNIIQSSQNRAEGAPSAGQKQNFTSITATKKGKSGVSSAQNVIGGLENSVTARRVYEGQPITSKTLDWWILWCDTNDEQDALERELGDLAVSIRGSQPTEIKEELHEIWLRGERKILISKVSIFGFGMDWSHCCRMMFLGRNFSYESYYQAVRRCWRFGQTRPVNVHLVVAEGEDTIGRVIDRKAGDHSAMKTAMRAAMLRATGKSSATKTPYNPTHKARTVPWLKSAV